MAFSDLVVNIAGNAQGLKKTLGGVTSGVRGVGSVASKVTAGLKLSFAGLAAAVAPLMVAFKGFQFLGEASDLANTQIQAEKKLAGVLKATGNAAGFSASEIAKLASERQAVTNFGDEATLAATGILATFKEIKGDNFKAAIPLMQDMAAVMEGDLNGAAMQLGKALNDPIAGLGALSRVGVQFSHEQKEMIKGLVETGQLAKAQGIIMQELQTQMGGTAEMMADPLTQASNAWGDFKEQIGMIFRDIAAAALEAFGFQDVMAASGNMAADFRQKWLPTIKGVLTSVSHIFKSVVGFLKKQWDSWIGETIKTTAFVVEDWKLFTQVAWERFKLFVSNSWERFKTFFVNAGEMMRWLGSNWATLVKDLATLLLAATKNMAKNLGSFFKAVWDFARGKGFKPKFTSVTDGWKSSLKDLPKFTKASVQKSTAELDRLQGEVNKRYLDFEKRFQVSPTGSAKANLPFASAAQAQGGGGIQREDFAVNSSIEAGTQAAYAKIFAALGGQQRDKKKPEKETADNTAETVKAINELKRLWERVERKIGVEKVVELIG